MEKEEVKVIPYEYVEALEKPNNEEPLEKVVGHQEQKKELLLVIDWFKNFEYWKSKNVKIPKGVLLYGAPGNGKSLLIKEAIKCIGLPTFIFKGDTNNISKGINETFNKAKEKSPSVVIIDELDLLIDQDNKVVRTLQENLDGVESSNSVLVIAATNSIFKIPEALKRNGRLEKILLIPYPSGEEAFELLQKELNKFKIKCNGELDKDGLEATLNGLTCAGVSAVANDVVLRNGFENIDSEMVYQSIRNVLRIFRGSEDTLNVKNIAVHEAGHAIMTLAFPKHFQITRLCLDSEGGSLSTKEIVKRFWSYDKLVADIKICLAGNIAEKVICKEGSMGCHRDLQDARRDAAIAIDYNGFSSCADTLVAIEPNDPGRIESESTRLHNEKKLKRLLKKCEREVTSYIKKHKGDVLKIAEALYEKKFLRASEVSSLLARN